ncbi:RsmB/NOP family class I SAM-dependent RNA methyltransferase [Parerythrobacter jejuensis]|uniref:Methyltransferase domain-containing protein n=1 Tax=Parerythrobacter jejuensis TaxID=795812 RepID=A0A845AR29_9SPHN|nr:RsmB/NOP family class I SAM-dependent RNA methyltransferase [Parerythrobacter jejuensis]MXP31311.1 methyltransferase domain-containing protein [Parerythrobacter jejuensis]MXP34071.1 methyltransferase domain-containing protein [Parerythrobacter jejuensis]
MAEPSGIHARRAALQMLDAVLRRGDTLEQAIGPATSRIRQAPDKALARAIANETLRWLTDLDAMIDSATRKKLADDARPRMVLRMMLAQWLRLETPPHAVIATGLPLLIGGARKLAHGVFSTLAKQEVELPAAPTLPDAVILRWGAGKSAAIAPGLAEPPPLDLTLRNSAETAQWANTLSADSFAPGHLRLSRGEAVENLPGFKDGAWWVQDIAASLPARLLGQGEGRHVLDLCAAPGGKSLQLAAAGWNVTALDLSKRRLDLLKDNLKRTGLKAAPVRADALTWEPKHQFDAILLDAPCTATGTCRRHPDVLHRISGRQIEEMTSLQMALLERAQGWLKPGGTLVYAVCSLESEEGEEQAAHVALTPTPITGDELPAGLKPTAEGWLRCDPGMLAEQGGLDGFFIARWRR